MDQFASIEDVRNEASTRKLFVAPELNAHGALVEATGAILCFNSAGEFVLVETDDPNAQCEDFGFETP